MEELDSAIIEGIQNDKFHDDSIKQRLSEFPQLEFIPYFLLDKDFGYNNMFFLTNLWYWEELSYEDWKQLLVKVSHKVLGVYSFFTFTYKFLKIDMIPFYISLENCDEGLKRYSLTYFFENPHFLQHDKDAEITIEMYSFDKGALGRMKEKLLSQGAIEAERIEPRKKLRVGYTTIEPPASWYAWEKDLGLED